MGSQHALRCRAGKVQGNDWIIVRRYSPDRRVRSDWQVEEKCSRVVNDFLCESSVISVPLVIIVAKNSTTETHRSLSFHRENQLRSLQKCEADQPLSIMI